MRRLTLFLIVLGVLAAWPASAWAVGGDVKWRVPLDGQYVLRPPAVGPDGNIAVASSNGSVYSVTPDGAVRWVLPGGGDGGPSIGADGTVYVASGGTITAISSAGETLWTFTDPDGQGVITGPTVGPDGNIYVVTDYPGLGAFALTPAGQLIWSNSGDPRFIEYGQLGADVVFDAGHLFLGFDEQGIALSTMYSLTLGGAQAWSRTMGGSDDIFMQRQRQPATGPDGSLYMTAMGGENGWNLLRIDPADGSVMWHYSPYPSNGMSPPTVGPDGSVFFSRSLGYLDSVTPAGTPRWTFFDGSIVDLPAVSPDGSVVVAGDRPEFGVPGNLRGWDAQTGALAWQAELPLQGDAYQIVYTRPTFSPDSSTAYVGTATFYNGDTTYLYAVDASGGSPPPPPPRGPRSGMRTARSEPSSARGRVSPPAESSARARRGTSSAGTARGSTSSSAAAAVSIARGTAA